MDLISGSFSDTVERAGETKMQNTDVLQTVGGQRVGRVRFVLQCLMPAAAEAPAHLSAWQRFSLKLIFQFECFFYSLDAPKQDT